MSFHITHRTLGAAVITAARFDRSGSGTTFFDEEGEMVAAFADGELTAVWPEEVEFAPPSDPE